MIFFRAEAVVLEERAQVVAKRRLGALTYRMATACGEVEKAAEWIISQACLHVGYTCSYSYLAISLSLMKQYGK